MHRVTRSLLFTGVVGLGLAGCGDDVTVTEPPPAAPSISITPPQATVTAGQTVVFGVTVTPAGTAFTCSVSPTSLGTVTATATGCSLATSASASGSGTVTASVANGPSASAAVTVNPVSTNPVGLSFVALNCGTNNPSGCATGAPAPLANVQGQVDAVINLQPNGNRIDSVVVFIGTQRAGNQTFSNPTAPIDLAAPSGLVTVSINTAAYTFNSPAQGTTTTDFKNGQYPVVVRAYNQANVVATANLPSSINSNEIVLNNTDGWAATVSLPQRSATSATGLVWYGGPGIPGTPGTDGKVGSMIVQVWPVVYTPNRSVNSVTFGFGAGPTTTKTALPFVDTLGVGTGPNYAGYQSPNTNVGENVVVTAAIDNATLTYPIGFVPNTVVPGSTPANFRVDYASPTAGTLNIASTSGNVNNWINGSYNFTAGLTGVADAGVGGVSTWFILGNAPQVTGGLPTTIIDSTTGVVPATITNSVTNAVYTAAARSRDALLNAVVTALTGTAAPPVGLHPAATFGVDRNPPVITAVAPNLPFDTLTQNTAAGNWVAAAVDSLSGFAQAPYPLNGLVDELHKVIGSASGAPVVTTMIGSGLVSATPFATSAAGSFIAATPAANAYAGTPTLIQGTAVPVPAGDEGYYIYQARAQDQAGNRSVVARSAVYVNNSVFPAVTGLNASATYTGGAAVVFPAAAEDSVEIINGELDLNYAATGGFLTYGRSFHPRQTKFDDTIFRPLGLNFQVPAFIRQINNTTAGGAINAGSIPGAPSQVGAIVYNGFADTVTVPPTATGANGVSNFFFAPILATQVPGVTSTSPWPTGAQAITFWGLDAPTTAASLSACVGGNRTLTFRVRATGAPSTFVNPFASAPLVLETASGATPVRWRIAPALPQRSPGSAVVTPLFTPPFPTLDNGTQRDFVWQVTITKPCGSGTFDFRVLGLNATFDGLLTTDATTIGAFPGGLTSVAF